jgi:hypothetical protein
MREIYIPVTSSDISIPFHHHEKTREVKLEEGCTYEIDVPQNIFTKIFGENYGHGVIAWTKIPVFEDSISSDYLGIFNPFNYDRCRGIDRLARAECYQEDVFSLGDGFLAKNVIKAFKFKVIKIFSTDEN